MRKIDMVIDTEIDMRKKTYAEFLRQFIGMKGACRIPLMGEPTVRFAVGENTAKSGEILDVGEDYVVCTEGDKSRYCVPISCFVLIIMEP